MSIYLESKADLAAMFSVAAGIVVSVGDLNYGTPTTTTTEEKAANQGHNTKIDLSFATSSTLGKGGDKFFYDRLDVAPLALANFKGSGAFEGQPLAAVIPILKNYTGAVFTTDDLVEHSTVTDQDGSITFLVEAKPTSVGWFGSVTVVMTKSPAMANEFSDDQLDGF